MAHLPYSPAVIINLLFSIVDQAVLIQMCVLVVLINNFIDDSLSMAVFYSDSQIINFLVVHALEPSQKFHLYGLFLLRST